MLRTLMSFYWVITLPEYKDLTFKNINDANDFRHKHNIPCKYQKRRKKFETVDLGYGRW